MLNRAELIVLLCAHVDTLHSGPPLISHQSLGMVSAEESFSPRMRGQVSYGSIIRSGLQSS